MRKFSFGKLLLSCLFICLASWVQAQSLQKIKGRITDSTGAPIAGASIQLKGKSKTVSSAQDGSFSINAPLQGVLRITAIGFTPKEISIVSNTELSITLLVNDRSMDEVVVTALGVKREKRNLTFSSQEIKAADIVKAQEPNLLNTMSGKVAGVQIASTSGAPGASSSIIIRGMTSITGDNQALIVLDGVPINNDETDGGGDGGAGNNRLADIDPAIVENINVLKGAAATALYGSAGARGVVLITTKSGSRSSKPVFTLSSSVSEETPNYAPRQYKYSLGTGGLYATGTGSGVMSTSWGALMDTLYINGVKAHVIKPDREFFQTGVTNNNTISVSGGNPLSSYFISYSYYDQKGTTPYTSNDRHSLFTKFYNQITPKLSVTSELTYSNNLDHLQNQGYGTTNPIMQVYPAPVSYDMKDYLNPDGTQRMYRNSRDNPYWLLHNVGNVSKVNRFLPVVNVVYTPLSWLSLTERIGADIYFDRFNGHVNTGSVAYSTGKLWSNTENFAQYNHDFIAQARKQFGKYNVSFLVGNNILAQHSGYTNAIGTGLARSGYYNMASSSATTYTESDYDKRKIGFYSQAEIDYQRFLVFSLSGRYDGSSVLKKEWYPYGSAAMGFIFSELLDGGIRNIMSFGKARISYAVVGNDNVDAYRNQTAYVQSTTGNLVWPYNGQNGFLLNSEEGNPNLKNELQKEFEVGLETKFFNNRIGLEASYYQRRTSNGLVDGASLAASTGYSSTTLNSAKINTNGLEVLLSGTPIRTKDISWDIVVNYSIFSNVVKEVAPGLDATEIGETYALKGKPYGMFYGNKYARDAKGNILVSSSGLPDIATDNGYLGTITPNWTGGITNEFHYKQFSFSFLIDTKQGGEMNNTDERYDMYYGSSKFTANRNPIVVKGVVDDGSGKANTTPVAAQTYYQTISNVLEAYMQKTSYVKLRNLSFSYAMNKAELSKMPFKEAIFTVTGRNLWIHHDAGFTGSDPESTNSYGVAQGNTGLYAYAPPTSKSIGVSVKLTF